MIFQTRSRPASDHILSTAGSRRAARKGCMNWYPGCACRLFISAEKSIDLKTLIDRSSILSRLSIQGSIFKVECTTWEVHTSAIQILSFLQQDSQILFVNRCIGVQGRPQKEKIRREPFFGEAETWTAVSRFEQTKRKTLFSLGAHSYTLMSSQKEEQSKTQKEFISLVGAECDCRKATQKQFASQYSSQWSDSLLVFKQSNTVTPPSVLVIKKSCHNANLSGFACSVTRVRKAVQEMTGQAGIFSCGVKGHRCVTLRRVPRGSTCISFHVGEQWLDMQLVCVCVFPLLPSRQTFYPTARDSQSNGLCNSTTLRGLIEQSGWIDKSSPTWRDDQSEKGICSTPWPDVFQNYSKW